MCSDVFPSDAMEHLTYTHTDIEAANAQMCLGKNLTVNGSEAPEIGAWKSDVPAFRRQ